MGTSKSSIVSINFSSKVINQNALFIGVYDKPYPDSMGQAIHEGEQFLNSTHGHYMWKPLQWTGVNLDGDLKKSAPKYKHEKIIEFNKNDLMLQIIKKKDRKKLNKYKQIFTPEELKFLREKLGYKKP